MKRVLLGALVSGFAAGSAFVLAVLCIAMVRLYISGRGLRETWLDRSIEGSLIHGTNGDVIALFVSWGIGLFAAYLWWMTTRGRR